MRPDANSQYPARHDDPDDGGIDFAALRHDIGFVVRAPLRHPWIALACVVFVVAVAAASSFVFKDMYQCSATLLAQRNQVMASISNPGVSRGNDWDTPTRAARESIIRRENLVSLCKQTGMVDKFLANRSWLGRLRDSISGRARTREEVTEALADTMESKLWVTVAPEGTLTIVFEWPDREVAYQVVEAAVQNFLEDRHASEVAVLGEAITILEGSAAKLREEVDASLQEVERRERARPQAAPRRAVSRAAARDDDLSRLQSTLGARRRALADLESFRQQRLADLNSQLAQKESIYAPAHPEVLATKQSIAALMQPSRASEALRAEIADLEREIGRKGGGTGAVDVATLPVQDLPEPSLSLDADDVRTEYARSRVRFARDQYASVLQRLSTARLELEATQAAFKYSYSVVRPPARPNAPKKPYTLLRIVGGVVGGIVLALFVTVAVDLRSGRFVEEWQVQRDLKLPILARRPP